MERLKRLRQEKGLSQARLAARAELDPSTVNQIERGAREASPATLRKLADALDISLYDLLEEIDHPKAVPPPDLGQSERHDLPSLEEIAKEAGHENGWIMASEEELKTIVRGRTWEEVFDKSLRLLDDIQVESQAFTAIAIRAQEDTPSSPEVREHFAGLFRRIGERHVRAHIWANEAARNYLEELDAPEQAIKELEEVSPLAQ
jgi:transcriptional regulator with XRE-family HTH domain